MLYVSGPQAGGMSRHLNALLGHFCRDWDVAVASPFVTGKGPWQNGEAAAAPKYFPLPLSGGSAPLGDGAVFMKLARICRSERVDLVHAHGYKAALVALPAARLSRCPALVTVHNFLAYPDISVLPESFFGRAVKAMDFLASHYIAVSEALRKELVAKGIECSKIARIYNGITPWNGERDDGRGGGGKGGGIDPLIGCRGLKVGTAGRLVPQKGMDIFIRAAAGAASRFPDARFFIAGEGPERVALERLRDELGMKERLFFLGHVPEMQPFYSALDLFVLASRSEGLSFTLLEAAAAGLPVIAAASGGIPEIIENGRNGLLFPVEDAPSLARAMLWLLGQPERREKLGCEASRDICRRFTEEKMLNETEEVYEKLAGRKR